MQVRTTFMRIGGTAAVLAAVALAAAPALTRAEAPAPRAVTVEMTAKRFAFLPEQVEVVEGDEVTINVRSADGTHGIEIGKLKVKKTIPRGGEVVTLSFTAPAPGRYAITCSEYCGRGHDDMKSALVVAPRNR
ncbi:MAG: cupredoxin domain-containing protein [Vicinamibacterales bacterium]|jgi:cytochrome c oxidase subunit 2|nr:cupredoxin domain-containing protein [Vicinamibacterales bacterium]